MVVLSLRDVLVDNDRIRNEFFAPYPGRKQLVEFDTDHYVDFTESRPDFATRVQEWIYQAGPSTAS